MSDSKVNIKIKSSADNKGFDSAQKSAKDFAKEIPGLSRALELLRNPVAQLGAALFALGRMLKSAISEFANAEQESARLDAALARTGQLTQAYHDKLQALAEQLQETTGISNDTWIEALRKLTQFGADAGNIDKLAQGVKNLAGFLDGDLTTAAELVGRAMQGSFELFTRYGIQAKNLTDLLKELESKGAGQLEARLKTLAGESENLGNVWSDFKKSLGEMISKSGVLQWTMGTLTTAFNAWNGAMGQTMPVLQGLQNQWGQAGIDSAQLGRDLDALKQKFIDNKQVLDDEIKALDRRRQKLNENARAQDEIRNAELAAEKSNVDRAVAEGKLTPEQGMMQKQAIELRFADRAQKEKEAQFAQQQKIAREQLNALQKEHATRLHQIDVLRHAVEQDEKASAAQALMNKARQQVEARRTDMLKAQDALLNGDIGGFWDRTSLAVAESRRFSGAVRRYNEAAKAARAAGPRVPGAQEQLALAQQSFADFEPGFQETGRTLIDQIQGVNTQRNTARRVFGLNTQTTVNEDIVALLGQREGLVHQQQQFGTNILSQLQKGSDSLSGGQGAVSAALDRLGQNLTGGYRDLANRISDLDRQVSYLRSWVRTSRDH